MPDIGSNGKIAPCLTLFALAALALSLTATFSCKFISQSGAEIKRHDHPKTDFPDDAILSQGFWSFEVSDSNSVIYIDTDGCTEYPDYWDTAFGSWPSQFTAARAFSIITLVLGIVLMCVGCCVACMPMPDTAFKCLGVAFLFQTLFEGLKFLVVLDRNHYSLEYGASCCIAATSLYFVCIPMSCCALKSSEGEEDDTAASKVADEPEKEEAEKEDAPKNEETPEPDEEAPAPDKDE